MKELSEDFLEKKSLEIHKNAGFVVTHVDTLLDVVGKSRSLGARSDKGHVDIPRMIEGKVNVIVFAAWCSPSPHFETEYQNRIEHTPLKRAMQLFDAFYLELEKNKDTLALATKYSDIVNINKSGKIAAMLSIEGGEALEGKLEALRFFYRLGLRSMCLTWNPRNEIADGVGELRTNSILTNFGVNVVKEMNKLGVVIDLSHITEAAFFDVLDLSTQPVILSHSNAYSVCDHVRNATDRQIKTLADKGGVIGINFAPSFLSKGQADVETVLDHIDYITRLVGMDYVGIGTDFDGIDHVPIGLGDVSKLPNITQGLIKRGYSVEDIGKILGENFLRVFKKVIG